MFCFWIEMIESKNYKILVVDDSISNILLIGSALRSELFYEIYIAMNGKEALDVLEKRDIDFILLDVVMPKMDGYEVAKELQNSSKNKDIPFVFLTSNTEEKSTLQGFELGARDYITKPFNPSILRTRVKTHLQFSQLQKETAQQKKYLEMQVEEKVKELRKKEQLLIQQAKMAEMGEMIGSIAHQWRQPISGINNIVNDLELDILLNDLSCIDSDTILSAVKQTQSLTKHLSQTIDDFRDFFKPSKDKIEFNIVQSIEESIKLLDKKLKNNSINLDINYESKDLTTIGYINEFKHVIINLVRNSEDAIKDKKISNPNIRINIYKKNRDIVIEVLDNAGGIPKNIIDKIFDPYFTTKDDTTGTGIGLYMSKTIIESHMDGMLYVDNTNDGAKFTIILTQIKT